MEKRHETLLAEPAVDLGQAQAVGQPGRDLSLMRREPLRERGGPPPGRPPQPAHKLRELRVGRRRGAAGQAHRDRRRHVLGDRLPIDAGALGDGAHAVAGTVPAPHFSQFDHTQLPIGHGHIPRGRRPQPSSGPGPGGGGKVLRISPSAGGNLLGNHTRCSEGWNLVIGQYLFKFITEGTPHFS